MDVFLFRSLICCLTLPKPFYPFSLSIQFNYLFILVKYLQYISLLQIKFQITLVN